MKYLELMRWKNLLIISFIGVIIRYAIILPTIKYSFPILMMDSNFSNLDFILLLIACLSIAASGNVINDYYDTKTDHINKPEKILIPKKISQNKALRLHHTLNVIGIVAGLFLSYKADNLSFAFLFVLPVILLRLYSINFSRILIVGNLIISFLAGLLIVTLGTFETLSFHQKWFPYLFTSEQVVISNSPTYTIFYWIFGLAFFSFLVTWIRELAKDIADIEGDRFVGAQTIPIKWGVKASKGFIIAISILTAVCVFILSSKMDNQNSFKFTFEYATLIIALLIGIIYLTVKADNKESYKFISTVCKGLMLIGILYPAINHIILHLV